MKRRILGQTLWDWVGGAVVIGIIVWLVAGYQAPCTNSRLPYDECMERRAELREGQR